MSEGKKKTELSDMVLFQEQLPNKSFDVVVYCLGEEKSGLRYSGPTFEDAYKYAKLLSMMEEYDGIATINIIQTCAVLHVKPEVRHKREITITTWDM